MILMKPKDQDFWLLTKHNRAWQIAYWFIAAALLFFVFSNRQYALSIRLLTITSLIAISYTLTNIINHQLIPKFLFTGRYAVFFYLLIHTIVFSIVVNYMLIFAILFFTISKTPLIALPTKNDVILLVSGSYIIILFAAITHFIKESYNQQIASNHIARQKSEAELMLKETRLKLLQGQLHPHFLFNMLNNLYGLWLEKDPGTPDVILKLSQLLEFMLYQCDKERIPLSTETQLINSYIELEQLRHDSRLTININYPQEPISKGIAPLILFSFVENAFKHGANKSVGQSVIDIKIEVSNNWLTFSVSNTYNPTDVANKRGIGQKNVEERLRLIYPQQHSLSYTIGSNTYAVDLKINLDA